MTELICFGGAEPGVEDLDNYIGGPVAAPNVAYSTAWATTGVASYHCTTTVPGYNFARVKYGATPTVPADVEYACLACSFMVPSLPDADDITFVGITEIGTATRVLAGIDPDGRLSLWNKGIIRAYSSAAIALNTTYWMALRYQKSTGNGTFYLYDQYGTLIDTVAIPTWGAPGNGGCGALVGPIWDTLGTFSDAHYSVYVDDILFRGSDAGWPAMPIRPKVPMFNPTGESTRNDWSVNTGDKHDAVADATIPSDGDTTYIYTHALIKTQGFTHAACGLPVGTTIYGVEVLNSFRKVSASPQVLIKNRLYTSGVGYIEDADYTNPTTDYVMYRLCSELSPPPTSLPWTPADLDDVQPTIYHYVSVASNDCYCTATRLTACYDGGIATPPVAAAGFMMII